MPSPPALPAQGSPCSSSLPAASAAHLLLVCSVSPNLWLLSLVWLEEKLLGDYFGARSPGRALAEPWGSSLLLPPPPPLTCCSSFPSLPAAHPILRPVLPSPCRFRDELQATTSSSWIFAATFPDVALSASLPARWADPCWNSGRSFPHLSSSRAPVGAPRAERSSRGRQDLRERASGSARMLQAVGHSLQRVGSRNSALLCGFSSLFCRPRGAEGRIKSGSVQRGMFELLFARVSAFLGFRGSQLGLLRFPLPLWV